VATELEREPVPASETFAEAILGRGFVDSLGEQKLSNSPKKWWRAIGRALDCLMRMPAEYRIAGMAALFAAFLFLPYLGAVGLWDPWETHYGEVGRSMIQRNDYVYPYWESAWFFSKPVLTMWMQALGMQIVGTNRTDGALALYTEWGMRLPFALWSILGIALMAYALARIVNRRVALATSFVLATMPLFFLLTRQSVTDTPFVASMMCAMACALVGLLDEGTKHRAAWWYGFYIFSALSALAKGLLGFGVPALVLLIYAGLCVMPWDSKSIEEHLRWLYDGDFRGEVRAGRARMPVLWDQMYRMKLGSGILIFLAIAVPWYATLIAFDGVDDEGKTFWTRFFIQDHFNRLAVGVHTTTPGGTFTYFIEQGGYAVFPWIALVPGALATVSRIKLRSRSKVHHLAILAALWAAGTFFVVAISATKFHHYIFPALPGLAILIALFIDRLWEEGIAAHALSLLFGLVLFILVGKDLSSNPKNFTDLFVYNYDRPYPFELVQRPISLFSGRSLWMGDLLAIVLIGIGGYLLLEAFAVKTRSVFARALALAMALLGVALLPATSTRGQLSPSLFMGLGMALVALYLLFELGRAEAEHKRTLAIASGVVGLCAALLFIVGIRAPPRMDPLLPTLLQPINLRMALGFGFSVAGVLCGIAALMRARTMLFGSFWALAFTFALWFNWSHWVSLSHHWTQRDLFWRYYAQRKADEPIVAFKMNWRGETFYSRNTVKQIKDDSRMGPYAALPGRKWVLVEHNRLQNLKQDIGPDRQVNVVDRDLNNKFVLVNFE